MIRRVHCQKFKEKRPSYNNVCICDEWKYLSNFIKWVDSQPNRDWMNCNLDKDIISGEDKIYSPHTCCFVTSQVNMFLKSSGVRMGEYKIGMSYNKRDGNYQARCNNPFTAKEVYLGSFASEEEAYIAYMSQKHVYSCMLADMQTDPNVARALTLKFNQHFIADRDVSANNINNQ